MFSVFEAIRFLMNTNVGYNIPAIFVKSLDICKLVADDLASESWSVSRIYAVSQTLLNL